MARLKGSSPVKFSTSAGASIRPTPQPKTQPLTISNRAGTGGSGVGMKRGGGRVGIPDKNIAIDYMQLANYYQQLFNAIGGGGAPSVQAFKPPSAESGGGNSPATASWNPRGGGGGGGNSDYNRSPASPVYFQPAEEMIDSPWSPRGGGSPYNNMYYPDGAPGSMPGAAGVGNAPNYWNANYNNWNDIRRLRDETDLSGITGSMEDMGGGGGSPVYYGGGGGGSWGGYKGGGGYKYSSPYDFYFNLLNWRI